MSLHDLYKKYHDRVQFLMIYIREAHPVDGWWLGGGIKGKFLKIAFPKVATDVYDPKTMDERREVARNCEETLQYGIHTYVDEMDDPVSKAYAAKPTRLFLIGIDGRVAYHGGPGPYGFKPAELRVALEAYLARKNEVFDAEHVAAD